MNKDEESGGLRLTGRYEGKPGLSPNDTHIGGLSKIPESILPAVIVIALFGYGFIFKLDLNIFFRFGLLFIMWWVALFFFWISPAFCFFKLEKRIPLAIKQMDCNSGVKRLLLVVFYCVYWPIYIPKCICLITFVIFYAIYYVSSKL